MLSPGVKSRSDSEEGEQAAMRPADHRYCGHLFPFIIWKLVKLIATAIMP